jgi:prephenate dehydrogenase
VVGTGLIGTSVALAARREDIRVYLSDINESAVRTAAILGAGVPETPPGTVDLAVIAVPPSRVAPVLLEQQARGLALSYTDVAGVKAGCEREILAGALDPTAYVGGHPMSGRDLSGPLAARADLFRDRAWVLTPTDRTSPLAFDRASQLVALCGASPVVMPSMTHDDLVALTSHLPHLVSSLMAARMQGSPAEAALLVGQGLRDVTRIAGGSSHLWSDIFGANASAVAETLTGLHDDLTRVLAALRDLAEPGSRLRAQSMRTLVDVLDRGIAGLREIRGAQPENACDVQVVVTDRPGELSRLLDATAEFGIGPEQVMICPAPAVQSDLLVRLRVDTLQVAALMSKLDIEEWDTGHDRPGLVAEHL